MLILSSSCDIFFIYYLHFGTTQTYIAEPLSPHEEHSCGALVRTNRVYNVMQETDALKETFIRFALSSFLHRP